MFTSVTTKLGKCTIVLSSMFRGRIRSYRRTLLLVFGLCFLVYLTTNVFTYFVDFYMPTWQAEPTRVDMSKLPIIKGQENFVPSVIEPVEIKEKLFILVLISSAAGSEVHYRKRMAIRDTWGKSSDGNGEWKITFFLGKTNNDFIDKQRVLEAEKYGDIIIGDFSDTYRNITQKLMMAFNWASKQNYEYLLKTDDDVYINVPLLIQWIRERPDSNKPLYAGVLYRVAVIRDSSHRHYVSWKDLKQEIYPWYPKGALYVLSSSVVRDMVQISSKVRMFTVDDAYIGVLASYLGVKPVHLHGFIQWGFLPKLLELFDRCVYSNVIGMADNLTPNDLYFVHQQVTMLRNSSKWMCVQIYHPILATVVLLILILAIIYKYFHSPVK